MALPPCAFIHIPKAAGNYVRQLLWHNVGREIEPARQCLIREEMDQRAFDAMSDAEIDRYRLITGHIGFRRIRHLEGRLRITVLRDPAERILSLYRYWRSASYDAPLFLLARSHALGDLLLGRGLPPDEKRWLGYYVDNAMTWQLADMFEERESSALHDAPPEAVLAAAEANLATCWVGIAEEADASVDLLAAEHGLVRPPGDMWRNESPAGAVDLDAAAVRGILGPRLALDDALYARAVERFAARRAVQGV